MITDDAIKRSKDFGAYVREQRESQGMSEEELAGRFMCSVATVQAVEAGGLEPTMERWMQCLRVFEPERLTAFLTGEDLSGDSWRFSPSDAGDEAPLDWGGIQMA